MQVLFDTSVYVGAFRGNRDAGLIFERWRGKSPIWVSSVVLEELDAGADATGSKTHREDGEGFREGATRAGSEPE